MTDSGAVLRLDEAHLLCSAKVSVLAARIDVRVLLVKGVALFQYGLRGNRIPADVDLLVEPSNFGVFCDALEAAGWREREEIFLTRHTAQHSRTFINDSWPTDLDVHRFMPGFLAPPDVVFDELWWSRGTMEFANVACAVPSREASILILALHSLRGAATEGRHRDELRNLATAQLSTVEGIELARLARSTGCAATLRPFLQSIRVDVEPTSEELRSPAYREWQVRVGSGSHGAYFWILALRVGGLARAPMVLWRAFWPSRHDLLVALPETSDTFLARSRARWRRLGRGLASLPRAVCALLLTLRQS